MSQPKPGDRFSFTYLDDEGGTLYEATVQRVLSNREEGLSSPEADFYVAEWLEALHSNPSAPVRSFTMMLGADCKTYIDGRAISVIFDDASS